MAQPFWQARAKLQWADQHLVELEAAWKRYLQTDFCEFWMEDKPDWRVVPEAPPVQGKVLKIRAKPLPIAFVLHTGDIIHTIRTALDYCVNEIVGGDFRIGFPTHKEREQLADSFRTEPEVIDGKTKKVGGNANIARAVEGLALFILDELKPYEGGNGLLWAITRLDNTDKHRMLTMVTSPNSVHDIEIADDQGNTFHVGRAVVQANGTLDALTFGTADMEIKKHGAITAEILFAEAGFVEGQPVLPTLVNMLKLTSETIERIREFVFVAGWKPATAA